MLRNCDSRRRQSALGLVPRGRFTYPIHRTLVGFSSGIQGTRGLLKKLGRGFCRSTCSFPMLMGDRHSSQRNTTATTSNTRYGLGMVGRRERHTPEYFAGLRCPDCSEGSDAAAARR